MANKISVKNISVSYVDKEVVKNISFTFDGGSLIGILGPNGAGKSTLVKAMLGLVPTQSGEIEIDGQPIHKQRKKIAYVPQRSNIDWDFPIIVKETVLLGTYPKLGLFHRPKKTDKEWAMACLEKVGMQDYAKSQIGELSGGQQQRVFLARALAQNADFLFLDEPFVGIDVASEEIIINILKGLKNEGKTIFVVHHDLAKVKDYFNEIIIINKELYGAGSVTAVFKEEIMKKAYQTKFQMAGGLEVGV
ncbi:metal ABC transporter ATP-binding protein [Oceanobacillus indicireducens]|uniref:Zinc ABC transporter ATP-binding protein n=1 Tax=Oceanobacillus indicireducens TaxID=1004261 RepID=A0A917Y2Z2_9BACI|nr:metal ABC transporter ATP-binding protein [Oceanobacillus indicireducens]GGN64737.1 zinc ABC transporter ATP-binding protein [Oceanobacillus indicireducens]